MVPGASRSLPGGLLILAMVVGLVGSAAADPADYCTAAPTGRAIYVSSPESGLVHEESGFRWEYSEQFANGAWTYSGGTEKSFSAEWVGLLTTTQLGSMYGDVTARWERVSTYNPCSDSSTSMSPVTVASGSVGNKSSAYVFTLGYWVAGLELMNYVRTTYEAGGNPFGSYNLKVRLGSYPGTDVLIGTYDVEFNPFAISGQTVSETTGELTPGTVNDDDGDGAPDDGSGSGGTDFGWFDWLKVIVDPEWWKSLFWPSEAQWAEIKGEITNHPTYKLLTYCTDLISNALPFSSESGHMVGEMGLEVDIPVVWEGTEYHIPMDLTPYEWFVNVIRTLLMGSMILAYLFWIRDRFSRVLGLGLETLSGSNVDTDGVIH